jgi:peptidoglycan/LPS O-acetylase OafA/YrhL
VVQATRALPGFEEHFHTSLDGYVVAGIITVFFVAMILVSLKKTGALGRRRWLLAGALTYPLYLIHENVGFMIFNTAYPTLNPHLVLWATVCVALACAYAVHVLVEKPLSPPMKRAIRVFLDQMRSLGARAGGRAQAEP